MYLTDCAYKMSKTKANGILSEEGKVSANVSDNFSNVLDFVGGFGVYQKRLYIIPYEPVIESYRPPGHKSNFYPIVTLSQMGEHGGEIVVTVTV